MDLRYKLILGGPKILHLFLENIVVRLGKVCSVVLPELLVVGGRFLELFPPIFFLFFGALTNHKPTALPVSLHDRVSPVNLHPLTPGSAKEELSFIPLTA